MTEKEKMVTKKLYDANYDETLYKERTEAKNLCYDYNQLRPSDEENQRIILKKLLGNIMAQLSRQKSKVFIMN